MTGSWMLATPRSAFACIISEASSAPEAGLPSGARLELVHVDDEPAEELGFDGGDFESGCGECAWRRSGR